MTDWSAIATIVGVCAVILGGAGMVVFALLPDRVFERWALRRRERQWRRIVRRAQR